MAPTVLSASSLSTRRDQLLGVIEEASRELFVVNFWLSVETESDGCWEWTGVRDHHGYGQYKRNLKAHRVAWGLTFGDPGESVVRHTCDNPGCVRPDHLQLGTLIENSRDMVARDRAYLAKLTAAQVRDIRQRIRNGEVQRAIARELKVHPMTINRIARGHAWKEVM